MFLDRRDRPRHLRGPGAVRLLLIRRYGKLDAILLVGAALAYALNSLVLKPLFAGSPFAWLFGGYLNDAVGGIAFLAYANLLIALYSPAKRIRRLPRCLAFIFACGLLWEYAFPVIVPNSTTDPLDLVAYLVGALAYWAIAFALEGRLANDARRAGREGVDSPL